jgi:DNA mismatch repair protein MSH6
MKQKSLTSFFSKAPVAGSGSKAPKTPAAKPLQKSAASVSNASNAKYKSDIARSSSDIDPPKTPESRLTDLRALNSSAADSTRSVAWSHSKGGSTPPTSDPIPIEQDEDEDVVMLSNEGNHVTSIKSVSNIYI